MDKPTPPETTIECSFCGYRDKKSTYKRICWPGIAAIIALSLLALSPLIILFAKVI